MKLFPRSLAGQLVALLLVALVASQVVSFAMFLAERNDAVRQADRIGLLESTASVMRMLAFAPPALRTEMATAAGSPRIRFWISPESAVPPPSASEGRVMLAMQFQEMFGGPLREPPRLAFVDHEGHLLDRPPEPDPRGSAASPWPSNRFDVMTSVPFNDGGWLNAQTQIRQEPLVWPLASAISSAIMALAILAIIAIMARRVTLPLRALAENADALGRGAPSAEQPEAGPEEVRRLTGAFNRMQERLRRFVTDRTRMLAAIGHDLRTPITSLRLRTELLDDEEARAKMLATLDEMQRMTDATLEFAREDAETEPTRSVDLAALIGSLVDDLAEMGKDVRFAESGRLPYRCRPSALRRAIDNLLQNAVQYGERAHVSLADSPAGPVITIDDDGPGVPESQMEEVFKPFGRLETSRSRASGGTGLGLSIARSIVLRHGGELVLSNRSGGGLRAEIRLPATDQAKEPAADPADNGQSPAAARP